MNESSFEEKFIDYITGERGKISVKPGDSSNKISNYVSRTLYWKYEENIKTTDDLWNNFKRIVELRNQNVLDKPLSAAEFSQVQTAIIKR